MAASDSAVSFADTDCVVYIEDGSTNSIELTPRQGTISWTEPTPPSTEVLHRNKHQSPSPVVRVTGSANVTGKFAMSEGTLKGSTAATPMEALMGRGLGASWTTTGRGDAVLRKIRIVVTNPSSGGATQTITFAYVRTDECTYDMGGADGAAMLEFSFTDFENTPTIT